MNKKFNVHFLDGAKAEQAVSNLIVLSNDILFLSSPAKERIKELEEIVRSKDYTKAHDYKFLTEENKKLHKEVDELRRDNKTLTRQINDQVARARKAGL